MLFSFVVLYILTIVYALPYGHIQNLNTLTLKCPGGQLWTNGGCRDTHYLIRTALSPVLLNWQLSDMSNVVTAPPNCPPGQDYGNGACRDPFRNVNFAQLSDMSNVVTAPPNCPPGQDYGNGACRDPFRNVNFAQLSDMSNVVTAPPNCPPGQDYGNGACRDPFRNVNFEQISDISSPHVVILPPNCPVGQQYTNGRCRDIYHRVNLGNILLLKKQPENLFHDYIRQILQNRIGLYGNSNIIHSYPRITTVPKQCPIGSRKDALGRCRERI